MSIEQKFVKVLPPLPKSIRYPKLIFNPSNTNEILLLTDKKICIYDIRKRAYKQLKDCKNYHPVVNFYKKRYCIPIIYKDFLLAIKDDKKFSIFKMDTGDKYKSKRKQVKLIESIILSGTCDNPRSKQEMILLDGQCIKEYNLFKDIIHHSKNNLDNFAMCVVFSGFGRYTKDHRVFTCIPINFDNYCDDNDEIRNVFTIGNNYKVNRKEKQLKQQSMIDKSKIVISSESEWLKNITRSKQFRHLTTKNVVPYHCTFGGFTWHLIKHRFIIVIGGIVSNSSENKEAVSSYIWYFDLSNLKLIKSKVFLPSGIFLHSSVVDDKNECVHIMGGMNTNEGCDPQAQNFHWKIQFYHMIDDWPVSPIEWDNERIIWIAYFKNNNNNHCLINKLSKDVVKYMLSFLK